MPATSQLDWLSSTTAMIVLFWSRVTRDLLRSFGWGIAALHRLDAATKLPFPRRPPHSISRFRGPNAELVGHIAETATDQGLSGQAEKGTIDQPYHCTDILAEICERVGGMGEEIGFQSTPQTGSLLRADSHRRDRMSRIGIAISGGAN